MRAPEWCVAEKHFGGAVWYVVCRIREVKGVGRPGFQEYYGGYIQSKDEARALADKLNKEETNEQ